MDGTDSLRENEEKYHALFEASQDAIFLETLDGQILDCNKSACEMFGYTKGEFIQLTVADLVSKDVASQLPVIIAQELEAGGIFIETLNQRKDGSRFPVEVTTRLVTIEAEKLVVTYVRDISERKQAEVALKAMEDVLQRRQEEMAALHAVSLKITAAQNLSALIETIVERAVSLLNGSGGGFYRCDPDRQEVRCEVSFQTQWDYTGVVLKYGEGVAGKVAQTGKPLIINDYVNWPGRASSLNGENAFYAILSAPVIWQEQVTGVLHVVDYSQDRSFTSDELELLTLFANQATIAIENARLFEQATIERRHLSLLYDINREVASSLDPDEILKRAITLTSQALGCLVGEAFLYIPDNEHLSLRALYGRRTKPLAKIDAELDMRLGRGLVGWVAQTSQPANVPDVTQDSHWMHIPGIDEDARSALCAPIMAGEKLLGAFTLLHREPAAYSQVHLDLMQTICQEVGLALENARLYEQVRNHARDLEQTVAQRTAELTELYKLSQEISYPVSYEELLHLVLQHLRNATGCEIVMGCLTLEDSRSLSIETNRPIDPAVTSELCSRGVELLKSLGNILSIPEQVECKVIQSSDFDIHQPPVHKLVSLIQAPIFIGKKSAGLLAAGSERVEAFTAAQVRLLTTFANQASTALQRLSTILTAQQRLLESLVEHLPVGVLLLDTDFHILVANPMGREFLSILNPGMDIRNDILFGLGNYTLQELIDQQASPLAVEITLEGLPRRIFSVQIRQAGLPAEKEQRQWVLTLSDITQERDSIARIQIQERLATVGQLAAGIAHDFNNIMAAILVYTDLLRYDTSLPSASLEKLSIIQGQIQRASSLIRQILDFSRKSVMEQSALDLLPLVKELDKMLGRVLPETIHLELSYQPGAYWVHGDPARLQQVFLNLALNARDAMPNGGVLRFELGNFQLTPGSTPPLPELPPGNWIYIAVIDTGTGIPSEVSEHLFEPFFTTKPVGQGTGLGLAQVYGIIKQHDGYIDVQSQISQGTTFKIYLPVLEVEQKSRSQLEPQALLRGEGQMVLVVEDDQATREALRSLLETQGYAVLTASNGSEAMQHIEQNQAALALVVSDVVMPKMGGMALYHFLREHHPKIKMLLVTGHPLDQESQISLEISQVHWLAKPFTVQEFNKAITDLLSAT